jgi:hypothetical protein
VRRRALSRLSLELELLELWFQEPTRLAPPCRVSQDNGSPACGQIHQSGGPKRPDERTSGGASHLRHRGRDSL